MIYASILLYQKVAIEHIVDEAAQKGVMIWSYHNRNIENGFVDSNDLRKKALYWNFYDEEQEEKLRMVRQYILKQKCLLSPKNISIDVHMDDHKLYKVLTVAIDERYRVPVLGEKHLSASTQIGIYQPVEFIRNVDLLADVEQLSEDKIAIIKKIGNQYRNSIQNAEDGINQLFSQMR